MLAFGFARMYACIMKSTDRVAEATGRAKGGVARAAKLTKEERSEAARKASTARWTKGMPIATHEGAVPLGDLDVPCAVIEKDGSVERVVTQSGFMRALGRARQAKGRQYYKGDVNLPAFLTAQNLKPFISKQLEVTSSQIEFVTMSGVRAFGYSADLLPEVCDVFIQAERAGMLARNQKHIADRAHVIMKALAHVGIAGLVDEATGYQEVRDKRALQTILDTYLRQELAKWAKTFPDEFYEQIYRLRGWVWKGRGVNPPQVVAHYTKDVVYQRMAPGLLEELERKNPIEGGRRKSKFPQWLTPDVGHPALSQHLHTVISFMRVPADGGWEEFMRLLDIAHPKKAESVKFLREREVQRKLPVDDLPLLEMMSPATEATGL